MFLLWRSRWSIYQSNDGHEYSNYTLASGAVVEEHGVDGDSSHLQIDWPR